MEILRLKDNNIDKIETKMIKEFANHPLHTGRKVKTRLIPTCYDIETTKTQSGKTFTYHAQLAWGDLVILTRNNVEMVKLLCRLAENEGMDNFYIGIANMSYEMAFILPMLAMRFNINENGIIPDPHKPLSLHCGKMQFVDICRIANSSLEVIGKNFTKTKKKSGDLDYSKIRNSKTPMSLSETRYCVNDVIVGKEYMEYLFNEFVLRNKKFPLTSTSVPRNMVKGEAMSKENKELRREIRKSFPRKLEDYLEMMNFLFRGGYTHANAYWVGEVVGNVTCADYTSDYPAIMVQESFATVFEEKILRLKDKVIEIEHLKNEDGLRTLLSAENMFAFKAHVTIKNVTRKTYHTYESENKIQNISKGVFDNGRLSRAESITVWLTEQDFHIYNRMYKWDSLEVHYLAVGFKHRLPDFVINTVRDMYSNKADLKRQGLDGTPEYVMAKGILNSCYGMLVQRLNIEKFEYKQLADGSYSFVKYLFDNTILDPPTSPSPKVWEKYQKRKEIFKNMVCNYTNNDRICGDYLYHTAEQICRGEELDYVQEYLRDDITSALRQLTYRNQVSEAFLSPNWGIWVTAYARRRLVDAIMDIEERAMELGEEPAICYYDTDSIYVRDIEKYKDIIDDWNIKTENWNLENLEPNLSDIGQFTFDPTCTRFKCLGAKRYIKEYPLSSKDCKKLNKKYEAEIKDGLISEFKENNPFVKCTIAGLPKQAFERKVLLEHLNPFEFFSDQMVLEEFESDKLTTEYTMHEYSEEVTDEYGNTEIMHEYSGVTLKEISFEMKLANIFIHYLQNEIRTS